MSLQDIESFLARTAFCFDCGALCQIDKMEWIEGRSERTCKRCVETPQVRIELDPAETKLSPELLANIGSGADDCHCADVDHGKGIPDFCVYYKGRSGKKSKRDAR